MRPRITVKEYRYFLIGSRIGNSISPILHNSALRVTRTPGSYELFEIPESRFDSTIKSLLDTPNVRGFNVTTPYKERIIPYLSSLDHRSQSIGAVNTVKVLRDGRMLGFNTDVDGILASLRRLRVKENTRCLILGAGGAARASAYTLLKMKCDLVVLNRTVSRANRLASDFEKQFPKSKIRVGKLNRTNLQRELRDCGLLINALTNRVPLRIDFAKASRQLKVFDLWYGSPSDVLLNARRHKVRSLDGLSMLVEQAACSFEIWARKIAPRKAMLKAGKESLSRQTNDDSL